MGHQEIRTIIDDTLHDLVERVEALDRDEIDLELGDGKVVLEFDDGVKLIVSRQSAADQIWLAEPNGGWHYDWRDGRWIDGKRGVELFASLAELIGAKLGESVRL